MPRLATIVGQQLTGIGIFETTVPLPSYISLNLDAATYNEGNNITATVNTSNVVDGTTVNYTVTGISTSDFTSGSLTGTFTVSSNTATASWSLALDGLTEGTDTFLITLAATDSAGNNTGSLSRSAEILDTSNDPNATYWLDDNDDPVSVRQIIGGTSMTINGVFATNPTVPKTIEGRISGTQTTITAVTANSGTFFEVDDTGNSANFVIGEQLNLLATTYSITPAASSVNEGSSLSFTVNTLNIPDGYTLYWSLDRSEDFATSSGSFTINSNAGSFTVTPTADTTTEGAETFTVSVRTNSTTGTIVATSSNITINDTSTAPSVDNFTSLLTRASATSTTDVSTVTLTFNNSTIGVVEGDIVNLNGSERWFSDNGYGSSASRYQGNRIVTFANSTTIEYSTDSFGGAFFSVPDYLNTFNLQNGIGIGVATVALRLSAASIAEFTRTGTGFLNIQANGGSIFFNVRAVFRNGAYDFDLRVTGISGVNRWRLKSGFVTAEYPVFPGTTQNFLVTPQFIPGVGDFTIATTGTGSSDYSDLVDTNLVFEQYY